MRSKKPLTWFGATADQSRLYGHACTLRPRSLRELGAKTDRFQVAGLDFCLPMGVSIYLTVGHLLEADCWVLLQIVTD